jgi:hypothetical protein
LNEDGGFSPEKFAAKLGDNRETLLRNRSIFTRKNENLAVNIAIKL